MTTEQKVSRAILEEESEIFLGNKVFKIYPPSLRTLIKVSAKLSELPSFDKDNTFYVESLLKAKDCEPLADVFALMIMGGRHSLIPFADKIRYRRLRRFILNNARPHDMANVLVELIGRMELDSFFAVTTSLTTINITKAKVES